MSGYSSSVVVFLGVFCAAIYVLTPQSSYGSSDSDSVTVTAEVTSATHLDIDECATGTPDVTDFGKVLPGTNSVTGTDCSIIFGSSNDTSHLRTYQTDGAGFAMSGTEHGILDTDTFATPNGWRRDSFGAGFDHGFGVAVQSDNKPVTVGHYSSGWYIARYMESGVLDTAGFNSPNGFRLLALGSDTEAYGVAIQPDGKIVVVGFVQNATSDILVARYLANGTLDTANFGAPNGYVALDFGGTQEVGYGVAIQDDGKIVVAGRIGGANDNGLVARLNDNGSLDTTGFNAPNGWISTNMGNAEEYRDVAIQDDDKIVAVGSSWGGATDAFAVARYLPTGTLDTAGFSSPNGWNRTVAGEGYGVVIQPDGKILASGGKDTVRVVRFNTNGSLNTAEFNAPTGYFSLAINGDDTDGRELVLLPDDRIVVGGMVFNGADLDPFVLGLRSNGTLDTTGFNSPSGFSVHDWEGNDEKLQGLALAPDSKVIMTGDSGGPNMATVARWKAEGVLDYEGGVSDWGLGSNMFGACLASTESGATSGVGMWTIDTNNIIGDCDDDIADPWYPIPATSGSPYAKIAESLASGTQTAQVNLRFGLRTANDQAAGLYSAPITFEVVAPNI